MPEREKATRKKQENKQKNRTHDDNSSELSEHHKSSGQDILNVGGTPFNPQIKKHVELLTKTSSAVDKANFLIRLQQSYGNRYVQRLIKSMGAQTKLTVSQPGDIYEQEADRVAEVVSKTIGQTLQRQEQEEEEEMLQAKQFIQRQEQEEEEEMLQAKQLIQRQEQEEEEMLQGKQFIQRQEQEEDEEIQMESTDNPPQAVYRDLETRINNTAGNGQPLSDTVRKPMEQAFGTDFSNVNVHTNSEANEFNQQLSARAFTTGQDIYFREGEYNPGTSQGQELLAHELTHVVQQMQGRVNPTRQIGGMDINDDRRLEGEADEMRNKAGNGTQPPAIYRNQQPSRNIDPASITQPVAQLNGKPTITHETEFTAPDGSGADRKKVGVGEKVTFRGSAAGKWAATGGTPRGLDNSDTFTWTAPDRKQAVAIKLSVGGIESSVWMNIIEPESITATKNSEMAFPPGTAGAGMKLTFNYHPKTVSFGNVEAKEVSGPATNISGYYQKYYTAAELKHDSGDTFYPIKEDNKDSAEDTASTQDPYTPYEAGTFDWVIPNHFKVKTEGGDGKKFTEVTQAFSIDATGKIKITKAGAEVERSP